MYNTKYNVMRYAICYHLYSLKKVKNTNVGAVLKVTLLHRSFSRF